jgi:hypothetical protein
MFIFCLPKKRTKKGIPITLVRLRLTSLTFNKWTGAAKLDRFQRPQHSSRFFRPFIKLLGKVMIGKKGNLLFKNPILSH